MSSESSQDRPDAPRPGDDLVSARIVTIPNLLTLVRIAGSGVLLWLAHQNLPLAFLWLFAGLLITDWLDGKLAIMFHQRSILGARLDSIADAIMYAVLLLGVAWLEPSFAQSQAALIIAMLASYALSVLIALIRFRRLPAYHTRAAKTCWLLVSIGAITIFAGGPYWPAQVALVAVILTNIEATAMSLVFKRWHTDVPSIYHALRLARKES